MQNAQNQQNHRVLDGEFSEILELIESSSESKKMQKKEKVMDYNYLSSDGKHSPLPMYPKVQRNF